MGKKPSSPLKIFIYLYILTVILQAPERCATRAGWFMLKWCVAECLCSYPGFNICGLQIKKRVREKYNQNGRSNGQTSQQNVVDDSDDSDDDDDTNNYANDRGNN